MIAEILGPDGKVHYRRPPDHHLIAEAYRTPGYSVRLVESEIYDAHEQAKWRPAKGDAVHAKLERAICKTTKRYLWTPKDEIEFVPALSPRIYGDGRALLQLTTIHSRPAFYVIRIDGRWQTDSDMNAPYGGPDVGDFVEQICSGLEEDFGSGRPDPDDEEESIRTEGRPWPALDDRDGFSWGRIDWPKLRSLRFQPHPYSWQGNLLATGFEPDAVCDAKGMQRWEDDGGRLAS